MFRWLLPKKNRRNIVATKTVRNREKHIYFSRNGYINFSIIVNGNRELLRKKRPRGRNKNVRVGNCRNVVSIAGITGALALSFGWQTLNTSGRNFRPLLSRTAVRPLGTKELYKHRFWYIRYYDRAKWRPACKNQIASPLIEVNYLHGNGDNLLLHRIMQVFIKANC